MSVTPALSHHLFDQLCLHLLLNVSEDQVGNYQVAVILKNQLGHSLFINCLHYSFSR